MTRIRRIKLIASAFLLFVTVAPVAQAEAFPSRPITLVVPFAAGGSSDIVARRFAEALREKTGVTVIIDNKPGAGGAIGINYVAKSKPDGYTLLYTSDSFLLSPLLRPSSPFEGSDFTPIVRLRLANVFVVVNKDIPAKNLSELIALAKTQPGKLQFGSGGEGTIMHLAGAQLVQRAGVDIGHVPYRGSAPALTDTIGGQIAMSLTGAPEAEQYGKSGHVRLIAMFGEHRSKALPDVPTMAESGYPGLVVQSLSGVMAPVKTPPEIVAYLRGKSLAAAKSERFTANGDSLELQPDTVMGGEAFGVWLATTREKFKATIEKGNIRLSQ